MFLKKWKPCSNASRNVSKINSKWYTNHLLKNLLFTRKSNSGRSSLTGRTIIRTKASLKRTLKLPVINYKMRTKEPTFISSLKLTPFSSKLLSLVVLSSGALTYLPALDTTRMFSLVCFNGSRAKYMRRRTACSFTLLFSALRLKKISNLETVPGRGVQYVRSAGCSARVVSVDKSTHSALVRLPSGVRKFFSIHSLALPGPSALKVKRKLTNTRSGFWRSFGLKPIVRGVARNPVDHPHGGRTKAIKYPRTPWGLTTKRK